MKIFPAIDLKDGHVVRLLKGDYSKMTVYGEDPLEVARGFQDAGAEFLHVVDLDGAKDGNTPNFAAVSEIIEGTDLKVEIGGGIRNEQIVMMIRRHGKNVAVGVDIAGDRVAINGWTQVTETTVDQMFETLIDDGVHTIICTDISKDGAMEGTNMDLYRHLVKEYGGYADIIASGGISSENELEQLAEIGVDGVIIGKALYTGAIDLAGAVERYNE